MRENEIYCPITENGFSLSDKVLPISAEINSISGAFSPCTFPSAWIIYSEAKITQTIYFCVCTHCEWFHFAQSSFETDAKKTSRRSVQMPLCVWYEQLWRVDGEVVAANEIHSAFNWNMRKALIWIPSFWVALFLSSPVWRKVFHYNEHRGTSNKNKLKNNKLHADDHHHRLRWLALHTSTAIHIQRCFTMLIPCKLMLFMEIMKFCCFRRQPVRCVHNTNARSRITNSNNCNHFIRPTHRIVLYCKRLTRVLSAHMLICVWMRRWLTRYIFLISFIFVFYYYLRFE